MNEIASDIDRLREIALDQHGYVTRRQAREAGISASSISQLKHRHRIESAAHGVYRIPQVPGGPHDDLALAVLWTGVGEAALSHETALWAYGVCDVNPTVVHVTVGRKRRIARAGGEGYLVHREDLQEGDVGWWDEIPTVRPMVACRQCVAWGTPSYLLRQAAERGRAAGTLLPGEADELLKLLEDRDGA